MNLWGKSKSTLLNSRQKMNRGMRVVWIKKGNALAQKGKYQEAIVCYDAVIAEDPENPMAWSFKAGVLLNLEQVEKSRDAYRKFVKYAKPEHAKYVTQAKDLIHDLDGILKKARSSRLRKA